MHNHTTSNTSHIVWLFIIWVQIVIIFLNCVGINVNLDNTCVRQGGFAQVNEDDEDDNEDEAND